MKKILLSLAVAAMATVTFAGGMYYGPANSRGSGTQFRFGRVELRMKTQAQSGVITGFIMISPDDTRASNQWCEWDIEITGGYPNCIEHTTHVYNNQTYPENRVFCTGRAYIWEDATTSDKFYTYAGEWTPNRITFEIDGFVFRTLENTGNNSYIDTRWNIISHEQESQNEYQVEKNNGPESLIDVWANVDMMCGFDTWNCANQDAWCSEWAGPYPGDDNTKAFFMTNFKYFSYTLGDGPDGSDFTLVTDENFDAANSANFNQYGCEFRGGYAISAFGGFSGELPEDEGVFVSKAYAPYAKAKLGQAWLNVKGDKLTYGVAKASNVVISMYDMSGKLVRNLVNSHQDAGENSIVIDSKSLATGTYLISLQAANVKTAVTMVANR
jgi:hypothetical protein